MTTDLYLPDVKKAFQMVERMKIPLDVRFTNDKTIIEQNRLLFVGDPSYTMSKQVLAAYDDNKICPI